MDNLNTTAGIVAIASGAVAVVGIGWSIGLTVALRKLKAAQRAVLGDSVAVTWSRTPRTCSPPTRRWRSTSRISGPGSIARMDHAETRLDGAVAHRALVRYDAYGEMSGRQSHSIALLDATARGSCCPRSTTVTRARLYAKQIHKGQPELELSPEETEAVRLALESAPAATRLGDRAPPPHRRAAAGGGELS